MRYVLSLCGHRECYAVIGDRHDWSYSRHLECKEIIMEMELRVE